MLRDLESVILAEGRSSDAPGAELGWVKPPPHGGLNQIVYILILSQCSLLYRPDTGEVMTPPSSPYKTHSVVGLFVAMFNQVQ